MLKQKLAAVLLIIMGIISAKVTYDGTACVMILMLMVPVLISKEDVENKKVSHTRCTEND